TRSTLVRTSLVVATLSLATACSSSESPAHEDATAGPGTGGGHAASAASATGSGGGATSSSGAGTGGSGASGACTGGKTFDPADLEATVQYLASDELAGRLAGSPGDEAARKFVADRFACLGLTPAGADGGYQQPFMMSTGDMTANVVGYIPGSDPVI